MSQETSENIQNNKSAKKIFKIFLNIFSIALIFYCLLATILIWLFDKQIISYVINNTKTSPAFVIIMPKMLIEFFLLVWPLTSFQAFDIIIWFWLIGILLIVIFGLTCFSIARTILKNKKENALTFLNLPWGRIALAIWLVIILFFGSTGTPSIKWNQPVTKVSHKIEAAQFGPLYNFVKYINRDNGNFKYRIALKDDNLVMQQLKNYNTPLNSYSIGKDGKINKIDNSMQIDAYDGYEKLSNYYECRSNEYYGDELQSEQNVCQEFWFKGQLIFKAPKNGIWVKNAIVNTNHTQLLIHISNGVYDPETIYLVELTKQEQTKSDEEIACLYWFMGESEKEIISNIKDDNQLKNIEIEYLMKWDANKNEEGVSITANEFCDSYLDYNYIAENLKNCFAEYDALSEEKRNEVNNYTADKEEEEILNLEGDDENLAIAQKMIGCTKIIMDRFTEENREKIFDELQEMKYFPAI